MITLPSFAAARALDTSVTHTGLVIAGRATPGDGGGGTFVAVPFAPDDDGTALIDAAGRTWRRVVDGAIDPKWFGMSPTSSDNSPAINAACSAAYRSGSRRVSLPAGEFAINGTIDASGVIIEGAGSLWATRLLKTPSNGHGIVMTGRRDGSDVGSAIVRDIWIDTDGGDNNCAIYAYTDTDAGPDNGLIERVRISHRATGTWYRGIFATGASRVSPDGIRKFTLRDVEVFSCRNQAIVLAHSHGTILDKCNAFAAGSIRNASGDWPGLWIGATANRKVFTSDIRNCKMDGKLTIGNATMYSVTDSNFAAGRSIDPNSTTPRSAYS